MFGPIETGGHSWPTWGSWWCNNHQQRCDPWTPVTADDLTRRAALDPQVEDDTFVVLSRAIRGDDDLMLGDGA